jgi:hypothetical protein
VTACRVLCSVGQRKERQPACVQEREGGDLFAFCSKGKMVLLHAMVGAWGQRRYSSYCFLTSALEGGEWSASRPGRALPPGTEPMVPIVQVAGWAPEPVWTQRLEEKFSASVRDRSPTVQSVVTHCTDWATPARSEMYRNLNLSVLFACNLVSHYDRKCCVRVIDSWLTVAGARRKLNPSIRVYLKHYALTHSQWKV